MRRLFPLGLVLLVLLARPSTSLGDWPIARHDSQRTAFVPGSSNITTPGLAWRYYLGGALTGNQYWAGDVDGSGIISIVYTAGGKVIVKHSDDAVVWETPPLALSQIIDVWDVDGDGVLDVVAGGIPSVVDIFSGKNGSLEWSLPAASNIHSDEIALPPTTRTADLDGDGKRDLYVTSFQCSGSGTCNNAVAYSFAGGFAGTTTPLWMIPAGTSTNNDGGGEGQDVIADINGDGIPDVIRVDVNDQAVQAFSGKTGALEWSSMEGADGSLTWESSFDAVPSTTSGGPEVVIYYEDLTLTGQPGYGGHRVMAFGYTGGAMAKLWEQDAAITVDAGSVSRFVAYDASSIGKFDTAGSWEVAFSLYDGTGWTLMVVNASSGAMVATLSGAEYLGAAVTQSGKPTSILATIGGMATVVTLANGSLTAGAAFPGEVTTHLDRKHAQTSSISTPVATTSIGGHPELIVYSGSTYEAIDVSSMSAAAAPVASYPLATGLTLLTTEVFTDPTTKLPQPYLALSSGFLVVLSPDNFQPLNMQGGEFPIPGMVIGGYYSGARDVGQTPVVGNFAGDGGAPSVVVQNSQGNLLRLDPGTKASVVEPPTSVWSIGGGSSPSLIDLDMDGIPEVALVSGAYVYAYKADGTTVVWKTSTSPNGVLYGLPFGDVNGDGVPDIFYSAITTTNGMTYNVLDGMSGTPLWTSPPTLPILVGRSPLAVGDVNGDGNADAVTGVNYPTYFSGPTGALIAQASNDSFGCPEPIIANILGGATPDVFFGGFYAPQLESADAGTIWSEDAGATPIDSGAPRFWTGEFAGLAPCNDGGSLFLEGEYLSPTLYAYDSATGTLAWSVSLASGKAFASGVPSGTLAGFLGNVTIKQDLLGTGHVEALVGSTDGYLYAVAACTGTLDWSYSFGFPVGEPVVADSTGAGVDQILVSVADGYLYALNREAIAPPAYVHVVDPPEGFPHTAVSTVHTVSTLYAEAASVPGATSYQWAVFTSGGSMLGTNGYQTVPAASGSVVDITASGLSLANNGEYFLAVRAVAADGASSDTISNKVKVIIGQSSVDAGTPKNPDGGKHASTDAAANSDAASTDGGSSGCGCSHAKPPERVPALFLALAPLLLVSRRRRRDP